MKGRIRCFFIINLLCNITIANPPFITQDPYIVDRKHFSFYFAEQSGNTGHDLELSIPTVEVDYGLMDNLEVDIIAQYLWNHIYIRGERNTSGIGDIQAILKYRIIKQTTYLPEISFVPVYFFPTGSPKKNLGNGRPYLEIPISMGKTFGASDVYTEFGYSINNEPETFNFYFGGIAWNLTLTDNWSIGAEIFALGAQAVGEKGSTLLNLGTGYSFNNNLALLFGIGHSIGGQKVLINYFGVNVSV